MRKYLFAFLTVAAIVATTLTVSVSTFAQSGTGGTGPAPVLIGHWTFDDGTATDSSGNGNDGVVNGALPAVGRIGSGSLDFQGLTDHVDLGGLDVVGDATTISAWVNSDNLANCAAGDCRVFSKANGVAEQDHFIMLSTIGTGSDARLRFRLKAGGTTETLIANSGLVGEQTWHHVAATYDGSAMKLFLDGVQVASTAKTGAIDNDPAVPAWIGGNPPDPAIRPWDGKIDDVRLYASALSASEILALASAQIPTTDFIFLADEIDDSIRRLEIGVWTPEDVRTGLSNPLDVAVDVENGRIYYSSVSDSKIRVANLDGTGGFTDLVNAPGRQIALDLENNKIYWANPDQGVVSGVRRADLTTGVIEDLVPGNPMGLALDVPGDRMYWHEDGTGIVKSARLDGTGVTTLFDPGATTNAGFMAIDVAGGKMYWAVENGIGHIKRANLDGTDPEIFLSIGGTGTMGPFGLALDAPAGRLYWTYRPGGTLRSVGLDGTGVETHATGFSRPNGITIARVPTFFPPPPPPGPEVVMDDVSVGANLNSMFSTSAILISDPTKTIDQPADEIKVFLDAGGGTKGTQIAGPGGTGEAVVLKVNNFGTALLLESHINTGLPGTDVIVEYLTGP